MTREMSRLLIRKWKTSLSGLTNSDFTQVIFYLWLSRRKIHRGDCYLSFGRPNIDRTVGPSSNRATSERKPNKDLPGYPSPCYHLD
jgi:hypothetical protein